METSRFPNKLKLYRQSAGYSRKKVARILGLTNTSMISRWELGNVAPTTAHLFRLARMYNVFPHELLDELWHQSNMESLLLEEAPDYSL